MYISILPATLLLSLATAQTTLSGSFATSTACAAQPVMDACYSSTSAIAQACSTTDYGCLCSKWNDVLTYAPLFPSLNPITNIHKAASTNVLTIRVTPRRYRPRRRTATTMWPTAPVPALPSLPLSPLQLRPLRLRLLRLRTRRVVLESLAARAGLQPVPLLPAPRRAVLRDWWLGRGVC